VNSPPANDGRRTRESLGRLLPDEPRRRLLFGAVGVVGSLVAVTYGVNFVLGPLNLGVLEFVWGVLLAVGGVAGLLASVAVLAPAVPALLPTATAGERPGDEGARSTADDDPVEHLKRRYAEGAVDDEEFERRLDRLLRSPDGEGSRDRSEPGPRTADRDRDRERTSDR
jgi:uncharacterized membrane protein